jgi:hypothetical protein
MFLVQGNNIADWNCPVTVGVNTWKTQGVINECAKVRNGGRFTTGRFQFVIEGGIYEWNSSLLATDKKIVQFFIGNFTSRSLPCLR